MEYYRRKPLETPQTNARYSARIPMSQEPGTSREDTSNPRALPVAPLPEPDAPPAPLTATPSMPPSAPSPVSLIGTASSIIEEELSAGMLAAQSVSPYGLPSGLPAALPALAGQSSGYPMSDMKTLLAAFDALSAAAAAARLLPAGTTYGFGDDSAQASNEAAPFLRPRSHVSAGQTATVNFTLFNDSAQPATVALQSTDLAGPSASRIPASCIRCSPSEVTLAPGAKAPCRVEIQVPAGTKAGTYSGKVSSDALPYLRAVLSVDVEPQ